MEILKSELAIVRDILLTDISDYAYYHLIPRGGDEDGMLFISSIPVHQTARADDAFISLFKVETCCSEDWDLCGWTPELLDKTLFNSYLEYLREMDFEQKDDEGFVESLVDFAKGTIKAQYSGSPLNEPQCSPDEDVVESTGVRSLIFLTKSNLKLLLKNRWNDKIGLFNDTKFWYLVTWCTNA